LTLQPSSRLKIIYLLYLSKPSSDRLIYRAIVRKKVRRILELGIGEGKRALRMIDAAARLAPRAEIQYVGMDLFEARNETDGPGLSLISAHRVLKQSGAWIKLIPGDPLNNLARMANDLGQFDLLIFSPQFKTHRLNPNWFFVPRLLHAQSMVYMESKLPGGANAMQVVSHRAIDQWAAKSVRWKAA
jgi:hypothetical protein